MPRHKRQRCLDDRPVLELPIPCPPLDREGPRGRVVKGEDDNKTNETEGSFDVDFLVDCYV